MKSRCKDTRYMYLDLDAPSFRLYYTDIMKAYDLASLQVPPRIERLKEELFTAETEICWERAHIYTEAWQANGRLPLDERRAEAVYAVFDRMPLFIRPGELLVGQRAATLGGRAIYPEFFIDGTPPEEVPTDILEAWKGRTLKDRVKTQHPPELRAAEAELAAGFVTGTGTGYGHVIVDYEKALRVGFEGIIEEARAGLKRMETEIAATNVDSDSPGHDPEGASFLRAVIRAAEGIIRWARRYADMIEEEAVRIPDPARKAELVRMADVCRRVPARPARTFHEALQCFWFVHLAMHIEQYGWSISAGRFDQYMWPFYRRDLEEGTATLEEQWELLLNLWVKFSENVGNKLLATTFQNLTIGGQDADGNDAVNDLSFLCLRATAYLHLNQPALSLRRHPGTDPEFWKEAHRTIATGVGMPALFNDAVIIPALERNGVDHSDALGYGIVGCVEASVPGKQQGVTAGGHINTAKALELALNDGVSMMTGKRLGPRVSTYAYQSFEELFEAYRVQVRHLADLNILASRLQGEEQKRSMRYPLMSSLLSDCLVKRRDLVFGTTRYNLPGIAIYGPSNAYDGLAAIKHLVFEQGRITLSELKEALLADFEGYESIRELLIEEAPKFGNDDPRVDDMVNEINAVHADYCRGFTDARNGTFTCGVWPVEGHVNAGRYTAATPDGRRAGDPLVDGVGACQGADRNGPSALLKSVAKLNNIDNWSVGNTCNIKFSPDIVRDEAGFTAMQDLTRTFMLLGGQELQVNVVDGAVLKDAQVHPERHRDLIVRVAGFSAYFTLLSEAVQNEIISRTEFASA